MQAPDVHLFLPFLLLLCCHNIPNPRLPIVVTIIIIFFFAGSRPYEWSLGTLGCARPDIRSFQFRISKPVQA
jgi:hypothetical protein